MAGSQTDGDGRSRCGWQGRRELAGSVEFTNGCDHRSRDGHASDLRLEVRYYEKNNPKKGMVVAGNHRRGEGLDQPNWPTHLSADAQSTLIVTDFSTSVAWSVIKFNVSLRSSPDILSVQIGDDGGKSENEFKFNRLAE